MAYTYKNPLEDGYVKVKFSRKRWNSLTNRKLAWYNTIRLYYSEDKEMFISEISMSKTAVVLNWLLLPLAMLVHGVGNYKEILKDHITETFPRKYGGFSEDRVFKGSRLYDKLKNLV